MNTQKPYQAYPQPGMPMQKFPQMEPQPERQTCAIVISVLNILFCLRGILVDINALMISPMSYLVYIEFFGLLSYLIFHIMIISKPDYLKGKPSIMKLIPVFILTLSKVVIFAILHGNVSEKIEAMLFNDLIYGVSASIFSYFAYTADDDSGSWLLFFKPWIHKRPVGIPQYGQYPAQGYPPQQGFPPQQAAYPYQQGYPPQQAPPQQPI